MSEYNSFENLLAQTRDEQEQTRDRLQEIQDKKEAGEESLESKVTESLLPIGLQGVQSGGGGLLGRAFEKAGIQDGKKLARQLVTDPNKAIGQMYQKTRGDVSQNLNDLSDRIRQGGVDKVNDVISDTKAPATKNLSNKNRYRQLSDENKGNVDKDVSAKQNETGKRLTQPEQDEILSKYDGGVKEASDLNKTKSLKTISKDPYNADSLTASRDAPLVVNKATPPALETDITRSDPTNLRIKTQLTGDEENLIRSRPPPALSRSPPALSADEIQPADLVPKLQQTADNAVNSAGRINPPDINNASDLIQSNVDGALDKAGINGLEKTTEKGFSTTVKDGIKTGLEVNAEDLENPVSDVLEVAGGLALLIGSTFGQKVNHQAVKSSFINPTFTAGIQED